MEASFPPDRFPASRMEEPDGGVRFVLKDGTEIHRLQPPDLLYDYETGEPSGRVDSHGRVLPLLPPVTHPEDLPAKNEDPGSSAVEGRNRPERAPRQPT
jgi:hypothetical protein